VVHSLNSFKDTFEPVKLVEVVLDFNPPMEDIGTQACPLCVYIGG